MLAENFRLVREDFEAAEPCSADGIIVALVAEISVFQLAIRARHLEEQVLEQRHADRLKARQTVVIEAEIVPIPQAGDNTRVEGEHTFPKLLLSS